MATIVIPGVDAFFASKKVEQWYDKVSTDTSIPTLTLTLARARALTLALVARQECLISMHRRSQTVPPPSLLSALVVVVCQEVIASVSRVQALTGRTLPNYVNP